MKLKEKYDIERLKADIREMNRLRRDPKAYQAAKDASIAAAKALPTTNNFVDRSGWGFDRTHNSEAATLLYMASAELHKNLHFRKRWIVNPDYNERIVGIDRILQFPTREDQQKMVAEILKKYERQPADPGAGI